MASRDPILTLKNLILSMANVESIRACVNEALNSGIETSEVIDALSDSLRQVGEKYEAGDFFLSELMMAAILSTEVTKILEPHMLKDKRRSIGKVVMGTVKGDIHDIGKNIVVMMLRASGFEVIDLGVDVSAEKFVEAVENARPNVLGMSALLTSTSDEMKNVIKLLKKKGLRKKVMIMIGGRPVTQEFADEIGADAYSRDSVEAISVVKRLVLV